jgi:IS4 transposase
LPRRRIRALARQRGVVRRRRKLDIVALVYSLVLGFASGDRRTLTTLRRAYLKATGVRLAPSSFHARFNAPLVDLMQTLTAEALQRVSHLRPKLRGVLAPFVEVLATDSALIRLHNALESEYPSVWRHYMKASAKLAVVMNVVGRGAKTVAITHGSRHDVHMLQAGRWMKGRLLVFDLGYYRAPLFQQIDAHGGFFLSRMKKQGNPVVVRSHRRAHRHLVGTKLRDAQREVEEETIDVDAEMVYQRRHPSRPRVTTHYARFRCVAIYNHELGQWHRYVTNVPTRMLKAKHFSAVYAARWEVELLFRELKGPYRLGHMPSANRHVTETLIYATLLTLLLSRQLYRALRARWRLDPRRMPFDRWAVLLAAVADDLLALVLKRHDRDWRASRIERFLRREATDPNAARTPLPYRAQSGVYRRA